MSTETAYKGSKTDDRWSEDSENNNHFGPKSKHILIPHTVGLARSDKSKPIGAKSIFFKP